MSFLGISLQGNKNPYKKLCKPLLRGESPCQGEFSRQGESSHQATSYQGESSHGQNLDELPEVAGIIRGVTFHAGFFYMYELDEDYFASLQGYNCDAVIDGSRKIVAVFLKPLEHTFYGIYYGEHGPRVKLTKISIKAVTIIFTFVKYEFLRILSLKKEMRKIRGW